MDKNQKQQLLDEVLEHIDGRVISAIEGYEAEDHLMDGELASEMTIQEVEEAFKEVSSRYVYGRIEHDGSSKDYPDTFEVVC